MTEKRFFWEIVPGTRCNLTCGTCYAAENARPDKRILNWDNIKKAQDKAIDIGMTSVEILGGEPLLYPQLDKFISNFKNRNPLGFCGVVSNGILVTPEKAKILKNSGLDQLTVSLDGTTPDINDKNRGMGSFDKAIQGINNARNAGLGVTIAYTVNPYNICDTKNIFPFAQTYDLEAIGIQVAEMVGRAKKTFANETQFNRTVGLNAIINTYDIPHQSIYSEVNTRLAFKQLLNRFYNAGMELPELRCDGGIETFMVSSGGDFLPCSQYAYGSNGEIRNSSVNLVTDSPSTISQASEKYLKFNNSMAGLEVKNFSTCQTCDNQESCAPCPLANPVGEVPECEWVNRQTQLLNSTIRESTLTLKIEPKSIGNSEISFNVPTQEQPIHLSIDRQSFRTMIDLGVVKNMEEWAGTDLVPTLCQLRSHQIISISGMESNIT